MTKKERDEVNQELLSLNEEIHDLKARLKAIRDWASERYDTRRHDLGRATDLRVKNWKVDR
jgi:uncharacterized coiled-coil DUF342 family protein